MSRQLLSVLYPSVPRAASEVHTGPTEPSNNLPTGSFIRSQRFPTTLFLLKLLRSFKNFFLDILKESVESQKATELLFLIGNIRMLLLDLCVWVEEGVRLRLHDLSQAERKTSAESAVYFPIC